MMMMMMIIIIITITIKKCAGNGTLNIAFSDEFAL
jgi:hypothetical protein